MGISWERVAVVGSSCSGKTTFARSLSRLIGAPNIELDELYWQPGWNPRPLEQFRALVREAVMPERWVADGNYSSARDIIWGRAATIIWLNYPFRVIIWRALSRTLKRVLSNEELFSGNRESFRQSFLSRDSILWWVITTYRVRRREYRSLVKSPEFSALNIIELNNPKEAQRLLELRVNTTGDAESN